MSVEINMDFLQYNNGKMNLQDTINKYEERNKSRLKSYKEIKNRDLLSLYVETEEIIEDLKRLL